MVRVLAIVISLMAVGPVFANFQQLSSSEDGQIAEKTFLNSLKGLISKNFNGAAIEFSGPIRWIRGGGTIDPSSQMTYLGSDSKGNGHFSILETDTGLSAEGWIPFSAWINAKIAKKRIRPGEILSNEMFSIERINVSSGMPYEYRGMILSGSLDVNGLESIQTIVEGNFLISSSVQKIPDVRRGDSIRIQLIAKGLTLTTQGVAEEAAYLNHSLRVMAGKAKKELQGKLLPGGVVEVHL